MVCKRAALFRGRHFTDEIIVLCVRWYLRYSLSYRDLTEIMCERNLSIDPSTIWRWVQRYAPELNERVRLELKPTNGSWRTDETFHEMPGNCQAILSCAMANIVRLRRVRLIIVLDRLYFSSVFLIRRLFSVGVSSMTPSPLPSALPLLALW
jgi:hypothetical protein